MKRSFWIGLCLLALVAGLGVLMFWPHGRPVVAGDGGVAANHGGGGAAATKNTAAVNAAAASARLSQMNTNPFAFRISNTKKSLGELMGDGHAILLENALIDTGSGRPLDIPAHLKAVGDPGAYIVQARGQTDARFRALLASAGARVVSYIPNNAYLVLVSAAGAGALSGSGLVQAVLPYEPYYKLQPSLLGRAVEQQPLTPGTALDLGLFAADAGAAEKQLAALGAKVIGTDQSPFGPVLRVLAPKDWTTLAQVPGVQVMEVAHQRVPANDLSRATLGVAADSTNTANWLNLSGSNVLVAVDDTGIDTNHPDLKGRVLLFNPTDGVDTSGHGTHVAGIIAGDGFESTTVSNAQGSINPGTAGQYRGMAPAATLYSINLNLSDRVLQQTAAATNALISNNSWVYGGDYDYDLAAASYDAATRDALPETNGPQPVLFVFAAGDSGNGPNSSGDTILSPATAKNVITVGALEQARDITNIVTTITPGTGTNAPTTNQVAYWQTETSSSSQVAPFSSCGNVGIGTEGTYGRFKPDVVTPGTFVVSTRSEQWDTNAFSNPTNVAATPYTGQLVTPGALNYYNVSVPPDAVRVVITLTSNRFSNPFPPNMPIYVKQSTYPTTNSYDFATSNNTVSIPPDGGSVISTYQNNGFDFAVGDSTNVAVNYDMTVAIYTTNNLGDYYQVLLGMDLNDLGPWYRYESGTSMSAANVSGMLALIDDYFTNTLHQTPSPALLKAMLINGARSGGGYSLALTNGVNFQGWGLPSLIDSLPLTNNAPIMAGPGSTLDSPLFFVDQSPTNALATGDSHTYTVNINTNASGPYGLSGQNLYLQATLVWTDPAGDPAAAIKLVNSLELVITNLDNPSQVYYGNDISPGGYNLPSDTNGPPNLDLINNVQNIILPPLLAGSYSVTVVGRSVNVNAVTTQTNNVVQDFALVVAVGEGEVTQPILSVADDGILSNPTDDQDITQVTTTNSPLMNQFVGASTPLLGTNSLALGGSSVWGPAGQLTVGMTNQWHFYVVTNNALDSSGSSADVTNAAFITFDPYTLSIPRMGVYQDTVANATRPEADIDLFVTTDSNLLTLDPVTISNCIHGPQVGASAAGPAFNGSSLGRGGTEFVADTNSTPGQVYYVGVQSQDQMASEYGFMAVFTATPFSQLNSNGDQVVNGLLLPTDVPDGSNAHPGVTNVFGLAIYPMKVARVTVTNLNEHQNFGDLFGVLNFGGTPVVLNNHDGLGDTYGAAPLVYDDSANPPLGTRHTDGPGSLQDYKGQSAIGPWILTEEDNSLTQTGRVSQFNLLIQPHRNLQNGIVTVTVPPQSWFYDYVDVTAGYTNMLVVATNLPPTSQPPIQLYLGFQTEPTASNYLAEADLTNCPPGFGTYPTGTYPGNSISYGPPLAPGTYWVGLFNPDTVAHDVNVGAFLSFNASAVSTVNWDSTGPVPLVDDAVMDNSIFVTNTDTIQNLNVGLRVDHPRISDLAFTLISPDGTRYLLMENRGGTSTNGCGVTFIATNSFANTSANGPANAATNVYNLGGTAGTLSITYDFSNTWNQMTVYASTNPADFALASPSLVFNTGLTASSGQTNLAFTTASGFLTIIMNQFTNVPGAVWSYTASGVATNYDYLAFTEDTNLTTTPIKFAVPPFVPSGGFSTNFILSDFEAATPGDYTGSFADESMWSVVSNQVSVMNDPVNAYGGSSNFLALANGTISNSIPTVPGAQYTLTFAYRGPGIVGWWRGESNSTALDVIGGNNGTFVGGVTFTNAVVGQGFQFNGVNYVDVPNNASINLTNSFTLEMWYRDDNTSFSSFGLMAKRGLTVIPCNFGINIVLPTGFGVYYNDPNYFYPTNGSDDTGAYETSRYLPIPPANVFHHVAATYAQADPTHVQLQTYIDGQLKKTKLLSGNLANTLNTSDLTIGASAPSAGGGENMNGVMDEVSIYNRSLSGSEVKAIWQDSTNGKFDHIEFNTSPALSLAEAVVSVPGTSANTTILGNNTTWQTKTITFTATNTTTPLVISGIEPGMLLDSFAVSAAGGGSNLYYQPEQDISGLIGTSAYGNWTLEVLDNRAGATNNASLVSWQLQFTFANTNFSLATITNSFPGPVTNFIPGGATQWYLVNVPTNADFATNSLLFATLPLNLWWSTNEPPTTTNVPPDTKLLAGSTGGSVVLSTNGSPVNPPTAFIIPGGSYYLGVQNPNVAGANYAVDVTFHLVFFAPQVTTLAATNIVTGSATLQASVTPEAADTTVYFEYGTDTNYGSFSTSILLTNNYNLAQLVGVGITNLAPPGQIYHFQAIATNSFGTNYGGDLTFTNPYAVPPPYAFTMPATLVNGSGAQLNGFATPNGYDAVAWFQWGTSSFYSSNTPPVDVGTNFNVVFVYTNIAGLLTNQAFHYRLVVSNEVGATYGFDQVFAQGSVVTWGSDFAGQTIPLPSGLTNLVAGVGAGYDFSLALNFDGTVVAWGDDSSGQTNVPGGMNNAVAVAGGYAHSLALRSDRTVTVWGDDTYNQTNVPLDLTNAVAAASGGYHCLALRDDGNPVAWGRDNNNQTNIPVGLSNVVAVAAGYAHSLALKNNGTVVAWGNDSSGQTNVPAGLTNVVAIAAGHDDSMALRRDGTVVAWGSNANGQTNVPASLTNVTAIAAGYYHCQALKGDGSVWFWGDSSSGQLNGYPGNLTNVFAISGGGFHTLSVQAPYGLNITNTPPYWTNGLNGSIVTMNELTVTNINNAALDSNSPPQLVFYSLLNPPSFASIDSFSGVITLAPQEVDGPGNYAITTVATDNGYPPLSATNSFTLVVNEVNTPPFWTNGVPSSTNYVIGVGTNLVVTNTASDSDIPINPLFYTLSVSPAITGAGISTNGIITWTPQAPGTFLFTTIVTDTNPPAVNAKSLSATNYITVTVTNQTTAAGVINISSITYTTNSLGSNGFLLKWFAPTNDYFKVQCTTNLAPANWLTFTNIISYTSLTSTNGIGFFEYFDDGTQIPFGPTRFYRLILLQATNTISFPAPANLSVTNGTPLVAVTNNSAVDSNPGAILTYSLLDAPANAAMSANGIITWTNAGPAGLAARFTTLVTDNGLPPASATNTFTVFVTPFPSITNVLVTATNVTLSWSAPTNDQFNVQWTTNLVSPIAWNLFPGIITSTNGLFSFTDTNAPLIMKFYELILLP
jgi:alpha-tubulin suppressor-like RCC1 family protein/subtilisin-like proprotein convertase family protein